MANLVTETKMYPRHNTVLNNTSKKKNECLLLLSKGVKTGRDTGVCLQAAESLIYVN